MTRPAYERFTVTPVTLMIAQRMRELLLEQRDLVRLMREGPTKMSAVNARRVINGEIGVSWNSAEALADALGFTSAYWRALNGAGEELALEST